MVQKKFKRTDFAKYSKLGVRRKNKQKYRKGKGIDNKMKLNMKGHLRAVRDGFRTAKKTRDLVKGLKPIQIFNVEDLKKVGEGMIGIIAKVGDKKRKEIAEYAIEKNIKLSLDPKVMLVKIEKKLKKSKEKQEKRKTKIIEKDKKSKKEAEKKAKKEAKEEAKASRGEETPEEKKDTSISDKDKSSEKQEKSGKTDVDNKQKESKKQIQTNNYGRGK